MLLKKPSLLAHFNLLNMIFVHLLQYVFHSNLVFLCPLKVENSNPAARLSVHLSVSSLFYPILSALPLKTAGEILIKLYMIDCH